jgi:hypothetical protein
VRPKTFAQLKAQGLDAMGNALAELECQFPFDNAPPSSGSGDSGSAASLFGVGTTLLRRVCFSSDYYPFA